MTTSLLIILSIFCSAAWAQTPPTPSCPSGEVECGGESPRRRCVPRVWLCDGDDDCRNGWDERQEQCANAACPSGWIKCLGESPRRRCIVPVWLCNGRNDCGNGWDEDEQRCASVTCPSGQVECGGESPRRRCIPSRWLCDGDNDCGNGWDESQCAGVSCRVGQVNCGGESPTRRCIPSRWRCDGDNDCGNGWDEDEEECANLLATVTCPPGRFQCPANRRRCISEYWLCDGDNDCGDNSDEDPANCRTSVIVSLRQCQRAIHQQCVAPVYRPLEGLNRTQVYEKLVNTHLRELCEPVLTAQQCVGQVAQSEACSQLESHLNHPSVIAVERYLTVANITVNHVCRENVEVFNEHKGCLLREMRGGIMRRIRQQCPNTSPTPTPCVPSSVLDCAENVVSQQCGAEIAGQLRALGTKVMEQYGCETHFEMKKKEMDLDFTGIKSMKKKKTHSLLDDMEEALYSLF